MKIGYKSLKFSYILCVLSIIILLVNNCSRIVRLPIQGVGAHRGANQTHPENTLAAFMEAIRLGAHMIEFDVRMTKDSVLVVIHDETVDRTTNGSGYIIEMESSEILQLDAGSWKNPKFRNERIPLFSEVIDVMPRNIWLNIHIKSGQVSLQKAVQYIFKKDRNRQSIFAFKSDSDEKTITINESIFYCNMDRLDNTSQYVNNTIKSKAEFIQIKSRADSVLVESVKKLKDSNITINYYYADSVEKYRKLVNNGIDFVLTNNLENILDESKALGIRSVTPKFK